MVILRNNQLVITGKHQSLNASDTLSEIHTWLNGIDNTDENFVIYVDCVYLNTISVKYLCDFFIDVKKVKGSQVSVIWYGGDEDMLSIGRDLESVSQLNFSYLYGKD